MVADRWWKQIENAIRYHVVHENLREIAVVLHHLKITGVYASAHCIAWFNKPIAMYAQERRWFRPPVNFRLEIIDYSRACYSPSRSYETYETMESSASGLGTFQSTSNSRKWLCERRNLRKRKRLSAHQERISPPTKSCYKYISIRRNFKLSRQITRENPQPTHSVSRY